MIHILVFKVLIFTNLNKMMTSDLSTLNTLLKANILSLNIAKTEFVIICT